MSHGFVLCVVPSPLIVDRHKYLYHEQNWSQVKIAGMLGVSQKTVSKDINIPGYKDDEAPPATSRVPGQAGQTGKRLTEQEKTEIARAKAFAANGLVV